MKPHSWPRVVFLDSWRPYAWVFLLACLAYLPALAFGFSPLDDRWLVVDQIDRLTDLSKLPLVFTRALFESTYYRPLLTLSFVIDACSGGGSPFPFHLTNVLLHGLASALVLALLIKLDLARAAAGALSVLFAVHPIHVHAVAWIPGRNDVLLAVFVLCASITFVAFLRRGHAAALLAHHLCVALALLTKETAVLLPAVLFVYLLSTARKRRETALLLGGWLVLVTLFLFVRSGLVSDLPSHVGRDIPGIAKESVLAFIIYCGKLVLPVQQAVFPSVADSSLVPGSLVLLSGLAVVAWKGLRDRRKALFGAAWFLGFLVLPLLHGASNGIGEHYEHRLYLPSIGFLIVLSQIDWGRLASPRARLLATASFAVVAALLLAKTVQRSPVYRNAWSIAKAGVRESPGLYFAYMVRADVRSDAGDYDAAVTDFHRAFAVMPVWSASRPYWHARLAGVLAKQGKTEESVEHYRQALGLRSEEAELQNNLGNGLARLGRLDEAVTAYHEALRIRADFAEAHNGLGVVLMRMGRLEEGVREFEEALRIQPDYAGARRNLKRGLELLGRPED